MLNLDLFKLAIFMFFMTKLYRFIFDPFHSSSPFSL